MPADQNNPKVLKGALVQLTEPFLGPAPIIITFQYNPESLSRTLNPWAPPADQASSAEQAGSGDTAQPYDPGETFNLVLEFDANDDLGRGAGGTGAALVGVADRIAALETLLYPTGDETLLTGALSALGGALGIGADAVATPRAQVPIVLFAWGPGRIVPVRITSFQVEEQAFSPTLYAIRAKVTAGMQVLGPAYFAQRRAAQKSRLSTTEGIAEAAYKYTRGQKELLARASVANTADSILGMLPF